MTQVHLTIDRDADAAYIRLSSEPVARTVEINDSVLVDVDSMGVVVGIEVLDLDADIPFGELKKRCHMRSEVIEAVRSVQPSISGFVRLYVGSDSATNVQSEQRHLTDA